MQPGNTPMNTEPGLPMRTQLRGSKLAARLFAWLGWQLHFDGLPGKQGVLLVYPHTSNWDFVYLLLAKWAIGIPVRFWGKHTLFRIPLFGIWLRWLGGMPVQRHLKQGAVAQMAQSMVASKDTDRFFWLALSPEGTRRWTPGWRSGFYRVALAAQVPIGICCVNFSAKRVHVTEFLQLSGDTGQDLQRIAMALQGAVGKHPEQAAPIQLLER